jgi:hypothetical protein
MKKIELKKDWERGMYKTVPAGTIISIDEALYEELRKKGLFGEAKKSLVEKKTEVKKETIVRKG